MHNVKTMLLLNTNHFEFINTILNNKESFNKDIFNILLSSIDFVITDDDTKSLNETIKKLKILNKKKDNITIGIIFGSIFSFIETDSLIDVYNVFAKITNKPIALNYKDIVIINNNDVCFEKKLSIKELLLKVDHFELILTILNNKSKFPKFIFDKTIKSVNFVCDTNN